MTELATHPLACHPRARTTIVRYLVALALLLLPLNAAAQEQGSDESGPFAVVIADSEQAPVSDPTTLSTTLRAALEKAGPSVLGDAAERFLQYHSKPSSELPTDVMDTLRKQIDQVTRDLAMGDLPSAVEGMEAIEGIQHQALAQLNRESEQARRLFTACVAMGVMLHESGKDDEALSRLQHCAASFPGFQLSPDAFSPQAIKLYQSAVATIDPVILRVDNGSPELPCTVRFNGLNVGTAPAELRVQRGWAGVQLECNDKPARMHVIMLSQPKQHLVIDPVLEYAVHVDGAALWLRYQDEATLARRAEEHGLAVTTALRVPRGLLARRKPEGDFRLALLDAESQRTSAETAWDGNEATLSDALARLLQGHTTPAPLVATTVEPPTSDFKTHTLVGLPTAWAWSWPIIGVAYGGSVGLSLLMLSQRADDREYATFLPTSQNPITFIRSELANLRSGYNRRGVMSLAFSSASNALAIAGSVLALPEDEGIPYWAYISGGVGVALAGTGAVLLAKNQSCGLTDGCTFSKNWDRDPLLPALLMIHAVGPLSVPLAYLIEKAVGASPGSVHLEASATASSAYFSLQGSF